jgi:hypothetical protein
VGASRGLPVEVESWLRNCTFARVSAADGDGASLVTAMIEEMRELYRGFDLNASDMPTAGAADLAPPGGTFFGQMRLSG